MGTDLTTGNPRIPLLPRLRFLTMPIVALALALPESACVSRDGRKEPIASRRSALDPPTPLGRATKVAASVTSTISLSHNCALLDNGGVACWGSGGAGQLGNGSAGDSSVPVAVTGVFDAVDVVLGAIQTCALRANSQVTCWGSSIALGNGSSDNSTVPVAVTGVSDAVAIAAGDLLTCAVRATGDTVCWGTGDQLGNGNFSSPLAVLVPGLTDTVALAIGESHLCALRRDHQVVCMGRGDFGELGDGSSTSSSVPVLVSGLTDAVAIAAGQAHTCALRANGQVVCWGSNDNSQLGTGTSTTSPVPVAVSGLSDAVEVTAGLRDTCARRTNGQVVCWGMGVLGQLGNGSFAGSAVPVPVAGLSDAVSVALSEGSACAVRATGDVVCWGSGPYGQLGNGHGGIFPVPTAVSGLSDAVGITAGYIHSCAVRADGTAACWGAGAEGELGNGDWTGIPHSVVAPEQALVNLFPATPVPVAVSGLSDVVSVAAGWASTFAIRSTGAVAGWGSSYFGQLGYGGNGFVPSPVGVAGLTGAVSIAGGARHACAVRDSGEVDCWGEDEYGQLGNAISDNTTFDLPAAVPGLSDGVSVAAGQDHTCAIRRTGEVACWGHNSWGELGDGTTNDSAVPVLVSGLSDAVGIGAGGEQTCAVRANGQVVCWGRGDGAELGNGTVPFSPTPTPVTVLDLSDAIAVAVGEMHTCALRANGQVVCWGYDLFGDIGDGISRPDNPRVPQPVTVSGLSDAVAIAVGAQHTCAVRKTAQAVCWGWGGDGQIGDGGLWMSNVPVPVLGFGDNTGQACGAAADCTSGFCVDGVCCASACGGGDPNDCQACSVAAGAASDGTCGPRASGKVCRALVGACDVAEVCNGTATACPADGFAPSSTVCRSSAGICDVAESCSGSSAACPADGFASSSTICRSSAGACDLPETCSGGSPVCPSDAFASAGVVCQTPASVCETAGVCAGAGPLCPGTTPIPGCTAQTISVCKPPSCAPPPVNLNGGASSTTPGGITLTFTEMDLTASVGVVASGIGLPPPTGYEVIGTSGGQPQYWDISTTTPIPYAGSIRVCIHYDPSRISPGNEPFITLRHDDGVHTCGGTPWCNITIGPVNTTAHVICGATNSLSPFAIIQPIPAPPVISVPANVVVEATGPTGAKVTYVATASDVRDGALNPVCSPASGSMFSIGTKTVTCRATDSGGLSASASFTVTVRDATGPTWSGVPTTINAFASSTNGAKVNYTPPKATDAVDGARTVTCTPASGTQFPVNKTTVTCKAADARGNQSTTTFTVWVTYQAPTDGTFFLLPIRPAGTSIFPIGARPVPLRFRLTGASASITTLAAKFAATKISNSIQGTANDVSDETVSDTGLTFVYRPLLTWYAYRWKTSDQTQGTYRLNADLGDGVVHQINVSLRATN
ncbi:MAG TPA: HYR domain-containing protein [Polyangia bacterium]|jgi:alpha-tubulin suppressor-like RCC1 family protein